MTATPEHPDLGEVLTAVTKYGKDVAAYETTLLLAQVATLTEAATSAERDKHAAESALEELQGKYELAQVKIAGLQLRIDELEEASAPAPAARPMLIGAAVGGNADPAYLETEAGQTLDVHRTYWQSGETSKLLASAKADIAAGRIPFPTIKFPFSWVEMKAGKGDAWAKTLASGLNALGSEVWISGAHEPNGDEPDILDWKAAQERLAPIFNVGKVNWAVSYTGYPELNDPEFAFSRTFPAGPIKGLFVDLYQRYGTTDAGSKWTPIADQFAKVAAFAKSKGIPWGLTETGVTDEAMTARPNALADHIALARQNGAAMFLYFDSAINSKGSWPLNGSTTAQKNKRAQFIAALKSV